MRSFASMLFVSALAGCLEDFGRNDDDHVDPVFAEIAAGRVGPEGGALIVEHGDYQGTALRIPPGALSTAVEFRIRRDPSQLPTNLWAFGFEPAATTFALPVQITVKYSRTYLEDFLLPNVDGVDLRPVSIGGPQGSEVYDTLDRDRDDRLVSFETTTLGRFTVLIEEGFGDQYRGFIQDRVLATAALVRDVDGDRLVVSGSRPGAVAEDVGKGSLADFWSSSRALLLFHATVGDAAQFAGPEDLAVGLEAEYDVIAVYQYRSGRPIAENAAWLYNEIKAKAQPGFRVDFIGYSMGGLVARCCIERSKDDPARGLLENFDPGRSAGALSARVGNLVTLGTPHAGAVDETRGRLLGIEALLSQDMVDDYFPGLRDLGTDGLGPSLNAAYVDDPAIRYFLIAGASNDGTLSPLIPGDDDGLVAVDSALGVPGLVPPEEALAFPPGGNPGFTFNHGNLHAEAVPNGIRDRIVEWLRRPPS